MADSQKTIKFEKRIYERARQTRTSEEAEEMRIQKQVAMTMSQVIKMSKAKTARQREDQALGSKNTSKTLLANLMSGKLAS